MARVLLTFLGLVAVVSFLLQVLTTGTWSQRFARLRRINRSLLFSLSVIGIVAALMFLLSNVDSLTN